MKILVAEDDKRLLKSLVHVFEVNNYSVDGVDNGSDAFEFASSNEYDGLVLDVMMPGMDGLALLKKLRENGITTPALFLTARTEIEQRIEGLDAGADDYRFYRADKARKFTGGYGIGLSMAKAIAENHKGEITAYKKDNNHICLKVVL